MVLFGLIFSLMLLASLGLAIGALRGRPLPGGSCREGYLVGHMLPRCDGCPVFDASATETTGTTGGQGHGHRP
jgi:hypothetical protein